MPKKLKIISVADTHRQHWDIKIPECDIFVFAGDGELDSAGALFDFNRWLGTIKAKHKIVSGGNHDFFLAEKPKEELQTYFTNAIYVQNESVEIMGIKFWASPYSVKFGNWAWMLNSQQLEKIWDTIPSDTDIVITHSPPFGILDDTGFSQVPCGCPKLLYKLEEIKPKYHIFGHIHNGSGVYVKGDTTFINASMLDDYYHLVNSHQAFLYNGGMND